MKPGLGMDAGSRTSMLWTLGDTIRTSTSRLTHRLLLWIENLDEKDPLSEGILLHQ
jgi:hypothetical protein